jgi:transketolase
MRKKGPIVMALTRQNLPVMDRSKLGAASGVAKGAYVVSDAAGGSPEVLLIATGSEVALALAGQELLAKGGVRARVVSMPSWELFSAQDAAYRESVLPAAVRARVSIEAGVTFGWERWIGERGVAIGINRFGASAPAEALMPYFGFTPEKVAEAAKKSLGR